MQLKRILVYGHCTHYSSQTTVLIILETKENNKNLLLIQIIKYNITNIKHTIYLLGYQVIIWICAFTTCLEVLPLGLL